MSKGKKMISRLLLLFSVLMCPLFAQDAEAPAEGPNEVIDQEKDYSPYPQPGSGYVTDIANFLTLEQEERIEKKLWRCESETGVEVVVVIINQMSDYAGTALTIEGFATGLFNTYGIGNLPKNDGVLMLISKNDRRMRIELGKYYGNTRDAESQKIVDKVTSHFKSGDFSKGVIKGVDEILYEFAGLGTNWLLIGLLIAVPILILIIISLFKNGKKGWGWVFIGILFTIILVIFQIIYHVGKHTNSSSSSGWSSGGFGGGFGGGSSGGGGASGGW
jgi:uncharacterized protein